MTMILLYGLILSVYSLCLWDSIVLTEILVRTDKWYWQTLLFIAGHIITFAELYLLVGIIGYF